MHYPVIVDAAPDDGRSMGKDTSVAIADEDDAGGDRGRWFEDGIEWRGDEVEMIRERCRLIQHTSR